MRDALVADLLGRPGDHEVVYEGETTTPGVDTPGMRFANEVGWTCPLTGFSTGVVDLDVLLPRLRAAPVRTWPDGRAYYKLHGWRHCIILPPSMHAALLVTMAEAVVDTAPLADASRRAMAAVIQQQRHT